MIATNFTENIVVNKTLTIKGANDLAQIKQLNTSFPAIKITAANAVIDDISIVGNKGMNNGIQVNADNVKLQQLDVSGFEYGIYVDSNSGCQITTCNAHGNDKDGIYLKKASGYLVENSYSQNNDANGII
jgi:parallel beta-helix repeat protein